MKLEREEVLQVAELAHLHLTEAEVESLRRELSEILTYIDKLNELDTSRVEPMAQVLAPSEDPNPSLRPDQEAPAPNDVARELLQQAADAAPPYFRVPKVIERSE
jgi:aspartyl-tRNA(Asn)/glutamyl-tRNA(Gln) amidotransferase subunit C